MLATRAARGLRAMGGVAVLAACGGKYTYGAGGAGGAATGGSIAFGGASATGGAGGVDAGGATTGGAAGSTATDQRAFFREYTDKAQPPYVSGGVAPPPTPGASVEISVSDDVVLRSLPRTLFGNNSAVWDGDNLLGTKMLDRLSAVNMPLLRFPGGSTSDNYHWDGSYPAYASAQGWDVMSQDWAVNTDEYMGVVRNLRAIPLITANYGYATYDSTATDGNVQNAARLAADWVEYCNSPNDGSNPNGGTDWAARRAAAGSPEPYGVRYWEIGNEIYGSWETGYEPNGDTYAANFNVIADAMRKVDPSLFIGLVTLVDNPFEPWTAAVFQHPGTLDRASFLVVHDYFRWISSTADLSPGSALGDTDQVAQHKAWLDSMVRNYGNRDPATLPAYLGEYNINLPTNPLQVSLVSSLFMSKVLGELATNGWAAGSLWDVANGWDDTSTSFGGGDHGFLSTSQPGVPDLTPRPSYYAYYFYTRNFGDHLVSVRSSDTQVVAYASTWSTGGAGLVVVNESVSSRTIHVSFSRFAPHGPANAWIVTGSSLTSEIVTLNGKGPSNTVAGGPVVADVTPYRLDPNGATLALDVPGGSVTSIVAY